MGERSLAWGPVHVLGFFQVGDIIRVQANEEFPCDMVMLSSNDPEGKCYITTANLDGETNLKVGGRGGVVVVVVVGGALQAWDHEPSFIARVLVSGQSGWRGWVVVVGGGGGGWLASLGYRPSFMARVLVSDTQKS